MIRIVGDDASIIYIQDLLVLTAFQHRGIGSSLLQQILARYAHIRQIALMADADETTIAFYRKNGMTETAAYEGIAFVKYNLNA